MRHTWRYFTYFVKCDGCDWSIIGVNGLGLAAQHHDRTSHSVRVEVEGGVHYLNDTDHAVRLKEKS